MTREQSEQNLRNKVAFMRKFLPLDKYIAGEKNSLDQIYSYFQTNRWAYRKFHSQDGFMHFRISKNGEYADADVYHQPNAVSAFIRPGDEVLEIGFGHAANLCYLANRHPDAHFTAYDLMPFRGDKPSNVTTYQQDYSRLQQLPDNSVDVAYAFETIVHNTDKDRIFKELYRVMKPGAVMVIFDYALGAQYDSYDAVIQTVIDLISKGGAAAIIESAADWEGHFAKNGLRLEERTDYTEEICPDLKRLEGLAIRLFNHRTISKLVFRLMPEQFVTNIILGYLGYDFMYSRTGYYYEWVLRK